MSALLLALHTLSYLSTFERLTIRAFARLVVSRCVGPGSQFASEI